jgi:hypothetical protein
MGILLPGRESGVGVDGELMGSGARNGPRSRLEAAKVRGQKPPAFEA